MQTLSRRELFRKGPLALFGVAAGSVLPRDSSIREDADGRIMIREGEKVVVQVAGSHVQVNQCNVEGGVSAGEDAHVTSSLFKMGEHSTGVQVDNARNSTVIGSSFQSPPLPPRSNLIIPRRGWHPSAAI